MYALHTGWSWSFAWPRATVALGLALAVAAGLSRAGDRPADEALYRNLRHTLLVRTALLQDKVLAPLNLGVKVEDRVAYLWGTVPSPDLIARAVNLVGRLPDVREVRSQLFVEEPPDNRPLFLPPPTIYRPGGPRLPASGFATPAPLPPARPQPAPAPLPVARPQPAPAPLPIAKPAPGQPKPIWTAVAPKEPVRAQPTVNSQSARPNEDLFVLPALAVPAPPQLTLEIAHRPAFPTLERQVEDLRSGNHRLRYLQAHVEEGRVYLNGWVYSWADLHELAAAVAQLPGVNHVVIGQIRVLPPPARQ